VSERPAFSLRRLLARLGPVGVGVAVYGALVGVGVGLSLVLPSSPDSEDTAARGRVEFLSYVAELYKSRTGDYPRKLEALAERMPNGDKPLLPARALLDPWGNPYGYDPAGPKNRGVMPDIWVERSSRVIGNWPGGRFSTFDPRPWIQTSANSTRK
jgi:hypothetical protein